MWFAASCPGIISYLYWYAVNPACGFGGPLFEFAAH